MQNEPEPLTPELREAEQTLKVTLDQACESNPLQADTGELIRIEEMLAIASDAAKKAISIRRKLRQRRQVKPTPQHRTFVDSAGVEWTVWAVHPEDRQVTRATRLRGTYSQGWLAFESEAGKRRLTPIPAGWEQVSEAELERMCTTAEQALQRTRRSGPIEPPKDNDSRA